MSPPKSSTCRIVPAYLQPWLQDMACTLLVSNLLPLKDRRKRESSKGNGGSQAHYEYLQNQSF